MARLQQALRKQAATTARAEALPAILQKRRGLHTTVKGLRSEEDPLQSGLTAAATTIRHSNLSGADKARELSSIAGEQAAVPASITNQISTAREGVGAEIGDLQTQEAAQRASLLSGLLTAATQRQQGIHDEIAKEGRESAGDLAQAQQEKELGLGSYDQTPSPEEAVQIPKIEAETAKTEAEVHGGGLTPYQQAEKAEAHKADHDEAATTAKSLLEGARTEGKVGEPKEWTPETWSHLVTATAVKAKVPIPVAEKAVGAIKDHFQPEVSGNGGFSAVNNSLAAAAGALSHSSGSAHPQNAPASPAALLQQLAPLHAGTY